MSESNEIDTQLAYWNSALRTGWVDEQARLDELFEPLSQALMQRAAPRQAESALDVGCGCGATTIDLAEAVGTGGRVLGVDISEQMLARAQERIKERGLVERVTLALADAQTYSFSARSCDLVLSRLGVMFFTKPNVAFTNLHRALRPGGRLAFLCPRTPEENRYISTPVEVARSVVRSRAIPVLQAGTTGMFSLAYPEQVKTMLESAGFSAITLESHDEAMHLGDPGQYAQAAAFSSKFGPLPAIMATLGPEEQQTVLAGIEAEYRRLEGASGIVLDGAFWIITARA